ncbi:MAG TPA: head maturation protease, ClpP-related [Anaerolineae bacterium]|nr:head maturation protease, ClpP-related [Anaerolineae bacterium]HUW95997.1 head maturation protease, ClpP-related [Anaerolineae bacterium]
MDRPSWYEIKNLGGEEADLFIFNEIGYGGVSAEAFMADLRTVLAGKINLHLNSPGGDVYQGIGIYTALKGHPAYVTTYVDALAASIASVIAMAGDKIIMARHSSMMIHEAQHIVIGDADDMRVMAVRLDTTSDQIASIYQERVPGSKALTWRNRMKAETWYTEKQAVAAGLADEVGGKATAQNSFDLSKYHNVPEAISSESEARKHCPDSEDALSEPPAILEPDPPAPAEEPFDQAAALRQAASLKITEVI